MRVVQATILSSGDGCLVLEGEVSENGDGDISIDGDNTGDTRITSMEDGQIKWLYGDSSLADGGDKEEVGAEELEDEDLESPEEDAMPNEIEEAPEYDLDFEIVPPSRYGESLGPVQAIIGLDGGDDVASKGGRAMSRTYSIVLTLFCALQAAMAIVSL